MPRARARIAAGISVASWNSAVLLVWLGRIPRLASRWISRAVLIGRPGCPPGNSQGEAALLYDLGLFNGDAGVVVD
jgi:hypothetical protein